MVPGVQLHDLEFGSPMCYLTRPWMLPHHFNSLRPSGAIDLGQQSTLTQSLRQWLVA